MKRFILAPDSFKGTMDAAAVCEIMQQAVLRHFPGAEVHCIPMADGGEGMVDAYLRVGGGRRVEVTVTGPLGAPVPSFYGVLPGGAAVIEMAAAAGLPLAWGSRDVQDRDPMVTTTRGVGELILHAAEHGATEIILGLGGSATNDGGIGMAAALGYRFLDAAGKPVEPVGGALCAIASIEKPATPLNLKVSAACDVDNPLCGPQGAAYIFGPQKGATPAQQAQLDTGLRHLAGCIQQTLGMDVLEVPGAGAAGGLGAGVLAFLGGSLQPGIDMLLDAAGFNALAKTAGLVLTGEGRIDAQSLRGKVPVGVARRAAAHGVPCIALCGCISGDIAPLYEEGLAAVFSSLRDNLPDFAAVQRDSRDNLAYLADSVLRVLALGSSAG